MSNSNRSITIWTAINSIAVVIALLFSSLIPSLQSMLKGEKITLETINTCSLTHYLGNMELNIPIYIQNDGGRDTTINSIICLVKGPDERYYILKAQTFDQLSQYYPGNQTFTMKPITLSPNDHWNESVAFYKDYSEFEQQEGEELYDEMLNNFKAKSDSYKSVSNLSKSTGYYILPRPEIDDKIMEKVKSYFNKKFVLTKGNFRIAIVLLSKLNDILCIKGYDFTIYDRQIQILENMVDNYKYGTLFTSELSKIIRSYTCITDKNDITLRLRAITDNEAIELYDNAKKYGVFRK